MSSPGDQHKAAATSVNPFEETKPHISEYTAQEIATLSSRLEKKLGPEYISSRPGPSGQKVHYLAADKCISLANEVFGFNGWSSGIQNIQIDFVDENQHSGAISLGLSVIVRVSLRDGTFHEDVGYGQVKNCKGKAEAFEKAKKEGTTDGLKRALRNFGNLLGNCVYDKDYVSKVTKLKVAPTKWDPDDLHRHRDFAPIKKDPIPDDPLKQADNPRLEREFPREAEASMTSSGEIEDEFGSDGFDETDLCVGNDEPPDRPALETATRSNHGRGRGGQPQTRDTVGPPQPASKRPQVPPGPLPGPQTPSAAPTNGWGPPVKAEFGNAMPHPPRGPSTSSTVTANQPQCLQGPTTTNAQNRRSELGPSARAIQTSSTTAPENTPPLDSSNTADRNPPVGFFTARAVESLQNGAAVPSNAPVFNPHLESPSIRKTAGIDHTKSKPVRTETIGAPLPPQQPPTSAATIPPRSNFVNPQADMTRRVGMPVGTASPLQNRGSYKPPQMKRQADGSVITNSRTALNDVTSASVNLPSESGGVVKRQRVAENVHGVATS